MSRAFVKEGDGPEPVLRAEIALPPGVPNLITSAGRAGFLARREAVRVERAGLGESGLDTARRAALDDEGRWLDARVASFVVQDPPADPERVGFGCEVELAGDLEPGRSWRIVGVDEADPDAGRISWQAPVARALLGARVGDEVVLRTPAGEQTVEVVAIRP